jgi:thiol-disulfide isomerase/thioredoxin
MIPARHVFIGLVLAGAAAAGVARAAADAPLAAGAPAPTFQLGSSDGKAVDLAGLKGKVVMINFWASWCGPCRKEMPILEQLNKQYRNKGLALIGVNVEPDSKAAMDWLKATPVSFPILFDTESRVSKLYQVAGMPNTVILDRKGTVRYIHRGYQAGAENEYLDQIRQLIRE